MKTLKNLPAWVWIVGAIAGYWLYDAVSKNKLSGNNPIGG
jgi:hypothetical protein